jgi:DIS3-like exonuclease 2
MTSARAGGNGSGRKQRFKEHLKHEELGQGLKRGSLFRAPFRSNAHDRTQAFATVAGLPSDLMIRVRTALPLPLAISAPCMFGP